MKIWNTKTVQADTVPGEVIEANELAKTKRQAFLWRSAKWVTVGTLAVIGAATAFGVGKCTGTKDDSDNAESVEN